MKWQAAFLALLMTFTVTTPANAAPIIAAIVGAIGLTGIAATIATVLLEVAFTLGASLLFNALFGPSAQQRQASVTQLQVGESPRMLIQGMAGVGGTLADAFNWGGDYGTDYECQIIVLADHRCHSLVEFYVNDNKIEYPGGGFSGGYVPDTNGAVYNNQLQVWWLDGSASQTLPSVVTNGGWSTTGNFSGISVAVVAYKADDPQSDTPVWSGGRPTFLWVVRGKYQYDPRLDSTVSGGSGSHRWDNPATWEWTDNAAVCRYNWVRGIYALDQVSDPQSLLMGRGLSAIEAPPENVAAYANICDEDVALVSGGSNNILAVRLRDTVGYQINFDGQVYAGASPLSTTWRYLATSLSDNIDRAAINFDDSGWSTSAGPFGNSGEPVFLAESTGAWFRTTVDVSVDSVHFHCDDVAEVWYNGAYIGFYGLGTHTVSLGSVASRTSEKRYTTNGVVKSIEKYVDTEKMYADAMGGIIIQPGGSVEVEPGHARTPTFTITDDDLVVGTRVAFSEFRSAADNAWINTVVPRYVEPSQKWQDHGAPVRRVDADVIADRGARELSLSLAQVISGTQAQRLGEIQRRLGRLFRTATLVLGPRFGGIEEGDWGTWTSNRYYGGASITWRVDAYQIDEKRQVTLTLREINPGVYDWTTADELSTDVAATPTTPPDPAWLSAYGPAGLVTIQLIAQSYPGSDLTITGSTTAIVISNHTRVYADRSVSVTGATISGSFTAGKTYWIYYDDAGRAGGAVAYHTTLVAADAQPSSANPFRHTVGSVVIPSSGTASGTSAAPVPVADAIGALPWKVRARACTTAALAANTYANGTSGVGATLTGTANGALAAQDGVTLALNERLLVAYEASGAHNGIYALTQLGDGSHPYILTRATDADAASELIDAAVMISEGTINADTMWICTTDAPITVGTTSLTFSKAEATAAEVNAGTSTIKAITPDALAGSNSGTQAVTLLVSDPAGSAITTGDGKLYWRVPSTLNGMNLIAVAAALTTASSSGIPTIQIANATHSADMLSTALTIDASETDSLTAATPAVIDTGHDDVATGDMLRIDIDVAGTGALGLIVELQFQLP